MFLEKLEEFQPLAAILARRRVTAGRIEQNPFRGEEPVAIPRATHPGHGLPVTVREIQPRLTDRRALPGCGVPDNHIPRQFVKGRFSRTLAELRGIELVNCRQQSLANLSYFTPLIGTRANHCLVGLTPQHLVQHASRPFGEYATEEQKEYPKKQDADDEVQP